MKVAAGIFLGIHLLSVAGIVVLLLLQAGKVTKVVPKGLTDAGLTAMVAGIAMVGIRQAQHHHDPHAYPLYNAGTLGVKFVVLIILLTLAFKNKKKESITRLEWATLLGLTVLNIGLAGTLK
jgi:preprotein translocase subunit SecG